MSCFAFHLQSVSVFLLTCVPLVSLYLCSCASSQFLPCPLCSCIILYDSWFVLTFVFLIIFIFFPWLSFVCLCCLPWEFWDFWTLHFSLSSKLAVCYFSFLPMCVSCIWVHSVKKTCFVMLNLALKMQKKILNYDYLFSLFHLWLHCSKSDLK